MEIEFKTAQQLICHRYQSVDGRQRPRASLPTDYLESVYIRYPVNKEGALMSRSYIDYVGNIVTILEAPTDTSVEAKIAFYASQGVFTAREIELMAGAFRGDAEVLSSTEFASFDTPETQLKEYVLRKRYRVQSLLQQVKQFAPGQGRDLIVSQGVSTNYFSGDHVAPTTEEWTQIEELIQSEVIIDILRRQDALGAVPQTRHGQGAEGDADDNPSNAVTEFIAASKGKVIYIDFWATWCSPCRAEIPDAKRLASEFAKDDVIFLNLCAQSREDDWSKLVKQKELGGEHMFLSDAEYDQLSKLYDVSGFPTYVLIDRAGTVISKNAPRPSSGTEIISLIRSLLK